MKNLKKKNVKLYPAFIFIVTKIVNSHREFRTSFNTAGDLGFWSEMLPSYIIFDKKTGTFSSIWSSTAPTFDAFHSQYNKDLADYKDKRGLFPKTPIPENNIPISMIPWSSFTAFNLNIHNDGDYLLPIITGGKYSQVEDEIFLPVSLQIHHAVCDGFHASMFMNDFGRLADASSEWL